MQCSECHAEDVLPGRKIGRSCRNRQERERRFERMASLRLLPCVVPGCTEPRHETPTQVLAKCKPHRLEEMRDINTARRRRLGVPEREPAKGRNRDKQRTRIRAYRLSTRVVRAYGFASREEYEARRDAASCAICGVRHEDRPLVFDHNHQTGVNRDWLCGVHNSGLGFFQDDPGLLRAAIAYMEAHR